MSRTSAVADPRVRQLRLHARIALYLSLALTIGGTWGLARIVRRPDPRSIHDVTKLQALFDGIDFTTYPEVQLLRDYVAIDSAEPGADEAGAAELLAKRLAEAGLEPHIERLGDRRANVWAFVEGEDPKAIALVGHLDVEPAREQEGWRFPPFSATIDGPWIYGRGMYDMKSLGAAQLLATTDLARASRKSGRKPQRSVLFLQTSAEETGSDTGTRWLLREHPELIGRIGMVLAEGGVVEALSYDQIKYWGIEFSQKRFAHFKACGGNRERLDDLANLLRATGQADPRPDISPQVRSFLASYSATRGLGSYQALLAAPDETVRHRPRFDRLTNFMKALFHEEVIPFATEPAEGGGFELTLVAHLLPGGSLEPLLANVLPEWKTLGITIRPAPVLGDGSASPIDSRDWKTLVRRVEREFPGIAVGPYYLPWAATDSRYFRAAGIPSYGFSPFPLTVTETLQIALPNERMQLPAYVRGVKLYSDLVAELAAQPWEGQ